jgi:hypothetical protein
MSAPVESAFIATNEIGELVYAFARESIVRCSGANERSS